MYAAELYSALDLSGLLFNISLTMCEVLEGTCSASALAERFENGKLVLEADLVIDAAAVFDHVSAQEAKPPHDASMTIHSLKLRELLVDNKKAGQDDLARYTRYAFRWPEQRHD